MNLALVLSLLLMGQKPLPLFSAGLHPIVIENFEPGIQCWSAIDKSIEGKSVVGIGKCTHGSHEVFVVKSNLIKHLILTQGFRGLAMEIPYASSIDIEKFVTKGVGDPKVAVQSCGFWTASNEEFLDLIKWIREFNQKQKPDSMVHVLGVDMQDTFPPSQLLQAMYRKAELKIEGLSDNYWYNTLRYQAEQKKSDLVLEMRSFSDQAMKVFRAKSDVDSARQLEMAQVVYEQACGNAQILYRGEDLWEMQASVAPFVAKVGDYAAAMAATNGLSPSSKWTIENLMTMSARPDNPIVLAKQLRSTATELETLNKTEPAKNFVAVLRMLVQAVIVAEDRKTSFRDIKMAENVLQFQRLFCRNKPTIFWAHNSHISQGEFNCVAYFAGANLAKTIGSRYYSIGFAFHSGSFNAYLVGNDPKLEARTVGPAKADSLEAMLHLVSESPFFADLKSVDEATRKWISAPHPSRGFGSNFDPTKPESYYETFSFSKWFQGLIFIDKLTAANQIPLS